jgi:hypothetical protein
MKATWFQTNDCLPTLKDADESGHVWLYDAQYQQVVSDHFSNADKPYYTAWMPKEKRPAPPAPKGEQQ